VGWVVDYFFQESHRLFLAQKARFHHTMCSPQVLLKLLGGSGSGHGRRRLIYNE
jgi:hypothetical protein